MGASKTVVQPAESVHFANQPINDSAPGNAADLNPESQGTASESLDMQIVAMKAQHQYI